MISFVGHPPSSHQVPSLSRSSPSSRRTLRPCHRASVELAMRLADTSAPEQNMPMGSSKRELIRKERLFSSFFISIFTVFLFLFLFSLLPTHLIQLYVTLFYFNGNLNNIKSNRVLGVTSLCSSLNEKISYESN